MRRIDEFWWGDVPVCAECGLAVTGYSETPPAPKVIKVEVPGGCDIDLTDALTGHAAYSDRVCTVKLVALPRAGGFAATRTRLRSLLHGKRSEFRFSWDLGYTYVGRASVTSDEWHAVPDSGELEVKITASPWKSAGTRTKTVSAVGGAMVTCRSGARPVHPLITCAYPTTVVFGGAQFTVPAGSTYRMNDVVFTEGDNEIWLNIHEWVTATWADLSANKWSDLSAVPWAHVLVDGGADDDFAGDGSVTLQWEEEYL